MLLLTLGKIEKKRKSAGLKKLQRKLALATKTEQTSGRAPVWQWEYLWIRWLAETHQQPVSEDKISLVSVFPAPNPVLNEGSNIYQFESKPSGCLYLEAGPWMGFAFCLIPKYFCISYVNTTEDLKQIPDSYHLRNGLCRFKVSLQKQ